jgi:hypothetical protein
VAVASPAIIVNIVTDFLVAQPSAEDIINFQLPESVQTRASELLALNRQNSLSASDRAEQEEFMRMEQFMTILKAKARLQLSKNA